MTPRLGCCLVCILLAAHAAHYGTYQGIPDPDLPGSVIMATRDAPQWQDVAVPGRFDSEEAQVQVTMRLPVTSTAASGAAFTLDDPVLGQLDRNVLGLG